MSLYILLFLSGFFIGLWVANHKSNNTKINMLFQVVLALIKSKTNKSVEEVVMSKHGDLGLIEFTHSGKHCINIVGAVNHRHVDLTITLKHSPLMTKGPELKEYSFPRHGGLILIPEPFKASQLSAEPITLTITWHGFTSNDSLPKSYLNTYSNSDIVDVRAFILTANTFRDSHEVQEAGLACID